MSELAPNPLKIFFSYSQKDKNLRDKLEEQLSLLKNQKLVSTWHDRKILPGDEFDREISENLEDADLILLLVSPSFIASKYCYEKEMVRALERHEAKEARVIPIILRPCDWNTAPFGKLVALPENGKPVTTWSNRDNAFLSIAQGIRKYIEENKTSPEKPVAESANKDNQKKAKHFLELPLLRVGFVPREYKEGEDFVQSLVKEISVPETELLVLWGPGGVGKTTLALQVARYFEEQKRVVWINADNRVDVSLGVLLDEIADSLDHPEFRQHPPAQKKEQVLNILRKDPSLVILDNFETVSPESQGECLGFLKLSGFVSLITTRDRIDDVKNRKIDEMLKSEAEEFLSRLMEDAALPQAFTKDVQAKIIEVAEKNPLVMQWIVGQIDLAQKPEDVFEDLSHGEGEAAKRVFDRSFNLPQLGDDGRRVLLVHSLFTQDARRKSIREIAGISDIKRFKEAVGNISSLRLITVTEGGERLLLQGLTRQLARAIFDKNQRAKYYRQKFIKYFTDFSDKHGKPTIENLQLLDEDKDNILTAIDSAFELNDWKSIFEIVVDFGEFLLIRGYWEERIHYFTKALELADDRQDYFNIGQFSNGLAVIYQYYGELGKAEILLQKSLEIDGKLGDQSGRAVSLNNLGAIAHLRGEFEKAEELFQKSLDIREKLKDHKGVATSTSNLGVIAQDKGELKKAEELFQKCLAIGEKLGDRQGISTSLNNLGVIAQYKGELDKAEELCRKSLEIEMKLGNRRDIAIGLNGVGSILKDKGALEEAEKLYLEGMEISEKLGDRLGIAESLHLVGEIHLEQKHLLQAETFAGKSLRMFQEMEVKDGIAKNKYLLGKIETEKGNLEEAKTLLKECLEIYTSSGFVSVSARAFWDYGLLLEKKKEFTNALESLKESLLIFEKLTSPKAEKVRDDILRIEKTYVSSE